ncbi:MAG: hypothetical protein GF364_02480 [Candidatus Lokiarchaeota archaeon]|nr:hypothetical protein [Candidatus Lokiarchaeota archaeon]
MGFEQYMTDNWGETLANIYNAFLEWFVSLEVSAQIITGILIVLGLIAVGYIIYGTLWLSYQIVKASIIFSIIVTYLSIVLVILLIESVFAIFGLLEKEHLENQWAHISYHVKYIIAKTYPTKDGKLPEKPVAKVSQKPAKVEKPIHQHISAQDHVNNAPVIILKRKSQEAKTEDEDVRIQAEDVGQNDLVETPVEAQDDNGYGKKYFCPNCGMEFSMGMLNILKDRAYTFCEVCGEKFYQRDMAQV